MSKALKIKTYKMMVKQAVVYRSKTWTMTEMDVKRLGTRERKTLRTYGSVVQQGKWRIRTNQELRKLYKDLDIEADIKKRLEWIGHVVRMEQGRTVMKIFESRPEGSRRGRSRLRWMEDVEKDLWQKKVKGW